MISVDLNQQPLVNLKASLRKLQGDGGPLKQKIGHFTQKKTFVDIPNTVFEIDFKSLIFCVELRLIVKINKYNAI